MKKGIFISVEGIEGVGKSTAVKFLVEYLKSKHIDVIATREPGGTPIAEEIRALLLKHHEELLSDDAELLLMFAGRAQHVAQKIKPALLQGQWVITDRFVDASFAYQGGGRGINIERIATLAKWVLDDFMPTLTLLLDAEVATGFARVSMRGNMTDRFEEEDRSFFDRVRDVYLQRAAQFPQRFRIIQADQPLVAVQQQLIDCINPLLGL